MALYVVSIDTLAVARVISGPCKDPDEISARAEAYWNEEALRGEEVLVVNESHPVLKFVKEVN